MQAPRISHPVKRHPTLSFVLLAYAASWSIAIPLALSNHGVLFVGLPFELHYLAQFGPMVAALLVTGLTAGYTGLTAIAQGISKWRVPRLGWLVALSPVLLFPVAAAIDRVVGGNWPSLHQIGQVNYLPYLGVAVVPLWLLTNGFGEEIGWRGYLLPALQRDRSALKATLILWLIWAGWHVPYLFYLPSYTDMGVAGLPAIALGILSGAIVLTWLYNSSGGSLLLVIVWHGLFNVFTASAAGQGTVATVSSVAVMIMAVMILFLARPSDLASRRRLSRAPTPRRTHA